jgi:hypothetical protein
MKGMRFRRLVLTAVAVCLMSAPSKAQAQLSNLELCFVLCAASGAAYGAVMGFSAEAVMHFTQGCMSSCFTG